MTIPQPDQQPAERSPDDFCRRCRGKGRLVDQEYRFGIGTVSVSETCWACNGSGYGR
jgi:DnaJ-class molecular chaperone